MKKIIFLLSFGGAQIICVEPEIIFTVLLQQKGKGKIFESENVEYLALNVSNIINVI